VFGWLLDALRSVFADSLVRHVHLVEDVHGAVPTEPLVRELLSQLPASSTLRFDAASISKRSRKVPAAMARQFSHSPHGSPSSPRFVQFSAFARMRAVLVFPVPRGPENRYAWPTRSSRTALRSAWVTCSWPRSSENRCGRYLRYRAW